MTPLPFLGGGGTNFIHYLYKVFGEISAKQTCLKLFFKTTPPPLKISFLRPCFMSKRGHFQLCIIPHRGHLTQNKNLFLPVFKAFYALSFTLKKFTGTYQCNIWVTLVNYCFHLSHSLTIRAMGEVRFLFLKIFISKFYILVNHDDLSA